MLVAKTPFMKPSWKRFSLIPMSALLLGLTGCDGILTTLGLRSPDRPTVSKVGRTTANTSGERLGTQSLNVSGNSRKLRNEVADIELTLPATWNENLQLHDSSELQASDLGNQLFVIVVAEEDGVLLQRSLQDNANRYHQLLTSTMTSVDSQTTTEVAFVGENFANQKEIRGRIGNNIPVVYLHTTVVTGRRYYQIVAWTSPEQYSFYKSELQAITDTFREI
jgi:hypothetical protein